MTKTEFVERTLRIGIWGAQVVLSDSELVKFAERSTMRPGGVAERCLEWYLNANGHDLHVEVFRTVLAMNHQMSSRSCVASRVSLKPEFILKALRARPAPGAALLSRCRRRSVRRARPQQIRSQYGGDGFALLGHPVFKVELFADYLKGVVESLPGVPVGSGLEGEVEDALLFWFEVDYHVASSGSEVSSGVNKMI